MYALNIVDAQPFVRSFLRCRCSNFLCCVRVLRPLLASITMVVVINILYISRIPSRKEEGEYWGRIENKFLSEKTQVVTLHGMRSCFSVRQQPGIQTSEEKLSINWIKLFLKLLSLKPFREMEFFFLYRSYEQSRYWIVFKQCSLYTCHNTPFSKLHFILFHTCRCRRNASSPLHIPSMIQCYTLAHMDIFFLVC